MLIRHTLIHGNLVTLAILYILKSMGRRYRFIFNYFLIIMFDTRLHFTPGRVQTGWKKLGSLKYLFTNFTCKEVSKQGWIIQDAFGLILNSVGNSRHRVEPWNIKFWDVGEDNGICKVEIWEGIREYLNCLEIICTLTDKMSHFSLPIFQVLQQNGNLEKTLHFICVQVQ